MPRLFNLSFLIPVLIVATTGCGSESGGPANNNKRAQPDHLVDVQPVTRQSTRTTLERTGTLRARRLVRIHNREEGRITALPHFEGDRVDAGDLLVQLDDELLRAELAKAKATAAQAQLELEQFRNLEQRRAASRDELSQAETKLQVAIADKNLLQTRIKHTKINAPFSGTVSARHVQPGDVVAKHSHILSLVDPASLIVEIHLSELLLPHLSPEDSVQVRIDALGDQRHGGKILRIHPVLDPASRQGVVEVQLDPAPPGAQAGQFARILLTTAKTERIMIPFSALRHDHQGEFVYTVDSSGSAVRTPIRSGIRIADQIEVLDGLQPGQSLVTRGFLGLFADKKVRITEHPSKE